MKNRPLIVGISGVTNGGKTTLTEKLKEGLSSCKTLNQDNYYLPEDSPQFVNIPELNHKNWDVITALDMNKMLQDINSIILTNPVPLNNISHSLTKTNRHILIIEGFCLFQCEPIEKMCDLKYFLTLSKEECWSRRKERVYVPPDCPGYFERCVWPEYLKHKEFVENNVNNVCFLDENANHFDHVLKDILGLLNNSV